MTTGRINQVTTVQKIQRNRPHCWVLIRSEPFCNKRATARSPEGIRLQQFVETHERYRLEQFWQSVTRHQHHSPQPYQSASSTSVSVPSPFCQDAMDMTTEEAPIRNRKRLLQGCRHAFNIPLTNTRTTVKLHSTEQAEASQNCSFNGRLTYSDSIHSQ